MDNTEILVWIGSFWLFATVGIPTIIEFIYQKIAAPKTSVWKSLWSWIIPIGLTYVVWAVGILFEMGFLVGYEVWWVPGIMGALAAGIANYGWNNIPWMKEAIIYVISLLPKTREVEEK